MSEQETIDDIMPSAVATDEEIRRWNALSNEEKKRRCALDLQQAYEYNRASQEPLTTMDDVRREARSTIQARKG